MFRNFIPFQPRIQGVHMIDQCSCTCKNGILDCSDCEDTCKWSTWSEWSGCLTQVQKSAFKLNKNISHETFD